jgi:hypothetical protein
MIIKITFFNVITNNILGRSGFDICRLGRLAIVQPDSGTLGFSFDFSLSLLSM